MNDFKPVFIVRNTVLNEDNQVILNVCYSLNQAIEFISLSNYQRVIIEEWYQPGLCMYYNYKGEVLWDDQ